VQIVAHNQPGTDFFMIAKNRAARFDLGQETRAGAALVRIIQSRALI
jgi:hypothetical protein